MDIFLPAGRSRAGTRLSASVYEQIRDAIVSGRLAPGDRVPPSRLLARDLGVSRHTITTVYGRLVAEGYLAGAAGGGTRVAGAALLVERPASGGFKPISPHVRLEPGPADDRTPELDLRLGMPDPSLFPVDEWRRRLSRQLRAPSAGLSSAGDPPGERPTREAIAAWTARSRGAVASADLVVVTAGAQHAFDILLTALVHPGDVVAVEDPGYPPFRDLAVARGATVVGVPVDDEGIVPDALPPSARVLHVTPSHQFPLGGTLPLRRRHQLLRWARQNGTTVIEDDYDSEFRYARRPLEPLQLLDPGCVVYVGTFSKSLSPALRLGFLIAPAPLVGTLASIRQLGGSAPDRFAQGALATLLTDGTFARHLHRARRVYRDRHRRLVERCKVDLAGAGEIVPSTAGLHVTVRLRDDLDPSAIVADAASNGVSVEQLDSYTVDQALPGLCLGFGRIGVDDVDEALDRLGRSAAGAGRVGDARSTA